MYIEMTIAASEEFCTARPHFIMPDELAQNIRNAVQQELKKYREEHGV